LYELLPIVGGYHTGKAHENQLVGWRHLSLHVLERYVRWRQDRGAWSMFLDQIVINKIRNMLEKSGQTAKIGGMTRPESANNPLFLALPSHSLPQEGAFWPRFEARMAQKWDYRRILSLPVYR